MGDQFNMGMALWGALGGTLPDISRAVLGYRQGDPNRWRDLWSVGFWVSAAGLAFLGFLVTGFANPSVGWSAVVTGAAAPALLSNAIGLRERQATPTADSQAVETPVSRLWRDVKGLWQR